MNYIHDEATLPSPAHAGIALERLFELAAVLGEFMERGLVERGADPGARQGDLAALPPRFGHPAQLAQALGVTPRNVTGLIDVLAEDGFVARGPHPSDRRATVVTLTEKGSSVAATLHAEEQAFARMMFGEVPAKDLSNFVATLDHVLGWLCGAGPTSPEEPS
jgi:DNA-binding MarR family transcriptional regulator